MISENKLFHERLHDELTGIAEFIFGWHGRRINQINLFLLFLERCQMRLADRTTKSAKRKGREIVPQPAQQLRDGYIAISQLVSEDYEMI